MIDRSYLPFQSAREYQDSKMQKWMGFFLSEHTSALSDDSVRVDFSTDLPMREKLFLLSQVYANQLTIQVTHMDGKRLTRSIGLVSHIRNESVLLKTKNGFDSIEIGNILKIETWEERNHESA